MTHLLGHGKSYATRDLTHQGDDGLAPYYFHPAVGFQTAMLAYQADQKDLTADQRTKITKDTGWMRKLLLRLSDGKDGEVHPLGQMTYPDSKNYISPLLGLALLPLIQKCDGKAVPRSYGILDRRLGERKPWAAKPIPEQRRDNKSHD